MNLTGQTFNTFTVIAQSDEHAKNRHRLYHCQCVCGAIELFGDDVIKLKRTGKTCNHITRGIRLDAITPDRIKLVLSRVDAKTDIFDAIRKERLSPNAFFLALGKDAELNTFYQIQRKVVIEELLEGARALMMEAEGKIELDKYKANLAFYQWKAEKLIPEAYGNRVQIDVNKTVDIRGALEEAKARAGIIEATYKTVVNEELKKELPGPTETLSPDSNEIDFAEIYQRSIRPTGEDLLG